MLNIHELHVFVEAAQVENFSVAAHRLYLSQPAVSLQIRNLEKQLGVELFRRNGRNVALSDAGKVLLPIAQDLLRQVKHIEEVMWGLQGAVIGELSIACSTTVGEYILPRLIAGFRLQYPDVRVAVKVLDRRTAMDCLLDGRADISVMSAQPGTRDLEVQAFVEDELVLIVPPDDPWADGRVLAPQELRAGRFVMSEPESGSYELLAEGLQDHGLSIAELPVVTTLGSAEAMAIAVEERIGAAFLSRFIATRSLSLGCVAEVPVKGMRLCGAICLARHLRRSATPPQEAFWEFALDPANEALRSHRATPPQLSTGPVYS